MQINHTWTVQTIYTRNIEGDAADVVTAVEYLLTTASGDLTVITAGTQFVGLPGDAFKAYTELTEAEVVAWVWAAIGEQRRWELETRAAQRLLDQVQAAAVKFVPWLPEPTGG